MQIHFNGTNFINAAQIFSLTRGPTRSWRNGDAQCCQLSNIADLFFFPSKSAQTLISLCKSPVLLPAVLLSQRAHISLSLSASALFSAQQREAQF